MFVVRVNCHMAQQRIHRLSALLQISDVLLNLFQGSNSTAAKSIKNIEFKSATMLRCLGLIYFVVAYVTRNAVAFTPALSLKTFGSRSLQLKSRAPIFATTIDAPVDTEEKVIIITPKAMAHISDLKTKQGLGTLRMGVRSGGCSGMSYVMDFIVDDLIAEDDHIEFYGDVKCVVDPKSLLYLYGLQLDYSDELIGGGFKFSNPNAETAW